MAATVNICLITTVKISTGNGNWGYCLSEECTTLDNFPNKKANEIDEKVPIESENCTVEDKNTGKISNCQFPFVFQNKTYYGCTNVTDDKFWCSTNVDEKSRQHIRYWGYCGDECFKHTEVEEISFEPEKCFAEKENSTKECQFPFVYEKITYFGCITLNDPEGKPWCSTKVNETTNEHILGKLMSISDSFFYLFSNLLI